MNIKEFAKAIGLAPSTVSTAIAGNGRVSPATRAMVRRKMRELGYTPNLNGRRLACGRSDLIAFCHVDYDPLGDLHSVQFARSLVQPLQDNGYDLFHILAGNTVEAYTMLSQRLKSSAVDGIILLGGERLPREVLEALTAEGHPCVVVGNWAVNGLPLVGSTVTGLRDGLRQAATTLVNYGHRVIGFVDNDLQDNFGEIFAEELSGLGVPLRSNNRAVVGRSADDGAAAFRKLMSQSISPTAVLTRTDMLAVGALRQAREMGMKVPEDVSIVGNDDLAILPLVEPDLTTIRVDYGGTASATAEMMVQLLHDPKTLVSPREVPTVLMERKTVGPVPPGR